MEGNAYAARTAEAAPRGAARRQGLAIRAAKLDCRDFVIGVFDFVAEAVGIWLIESDLGPCGFDRWVCEGLASANESTARSAAKVVNNFTFFPSPV